MKDTVPAGELEGVVLSNDQVAEFGFQPREEKDQWLRRWSGEDHTRLGLEYHQPHEDDTPENEHEQDAKKVLRLKARAHNDYAA